MEFIMNEWESIVGSVIIAFVVGLGIYRFVTMPKEKKKAKVHAWLIFAVAKAEKEFGSGNGKIKLSFVYDLFMIKFPFLSKVISFEKFSGLVDEALKDMKETLEKNK